MDAPASARAFAIANPKPPSSATPATNARFPVRSIDNMGGTLSPVSPNRYTPRHDEEGPRGRVRPRRRRVLQRAGSAPIRRGVVPLGTRRRRRDLGRLLWMELRSGGRGLRGAPSGDHDHHRDVRWTLFQHRRNGGCASAYGRSILLRALGDGALGRIHHGARREYGVRVDASGHRRGHRRIPRCDLRDSAGRRTPLVARGIRRVRRPQRRGRRDHLPVHGADHGARAWRIAGVLGGRRSAFRPVVGAEPRAG